MYTARELTQKLNPEEYATLSEKCYSDGAESFGVEHVDISHLHHNKKVVIVRFSNGNKKTYYL